MKHGIPVVTEMEEVSATYYTDGSFEKDIYPDGSVRNIHYITAGNGLFAILITDENEQESLYYVLKDNLGSIHVMTDESGNKLCEMSFDPWGRRRNPEDWSYEDVSIPTITRRGFTMHEHMDEFLLINMNGRVYDTVLGLFLSPDNNVQVPDFTQNLNRYSYCVNNPLKFNDPTGNFLTWSFGNGGFSIGINFTPLGIPLGYGINVGFRNGFSTGVYGEVGYRVGGTRLGSGCTISQNIDYNFKSQNWSTSTSEGAYASLGPMNVGESASLTYDITSHSINSGWGVSAGINFGGDDESGWGWNVGFGSGGYSYGIGGYYNSHAWDSNPTYDPDQWNNDENKLKNNNCYTYSINEPDNPQNHYRGRDPGELSGVRLKSLDLDEVANAAISDGLKKPNLLNKLGFGKRGYYEVYLVVGDGDYHWYRQDKGGFWSQKHGLLPVDNIDGSFNLISNPSIANQSYFNGLVNYNGGGIFLWVKKR